MVLVVSISHLKKWTQIYKVDEALWCIKHYENEHAYVKNLLSFFFWFFFHGSVWYNFENVAIDVYWSLLDNVAEYAGGGRLAPYSQSQVPVIWSTSGALDRNKFLLISFYFHNLFVYLCFYIVSSSPHPYYDFDFIYL